MTTVSPRLTEELKEIVAAQAARAGVTWSSISPRFSPPTPAPSQRPNAISRPGRHAPGCRIGARHPGRRGQAAAATRGGSAGDAE